MTSEVKKDLIAILTKIITEHQEKRKTITDEVLDKFLAIRPIQP